MKYVLILACLAILTPAATASAASTQSPIQERIDSLIASHGGVQTSPNTVVWEGGAIILEVWDPSVSTTQATACAAGRYCVFSSTFYTGNKISYSTCPATLTAFGSLGGPVRSIKNNRSSGTVRAYSGTTLKSTLPPGAGAGSVLAIDKITCS